MLEIVFFYVLGTFKKKWHQSVTLRVKNQLLYAFNIHIMLLHTYQCFLNSKDFGEKRTKFFFYESYFKTIV